MSSIKVASLLGKRDREKERERERASERYREEWRERERERGREIEKCFHRPYFFKKCCLDPFWRFFFVIGFLESDPPEVPKGKVGSALKGLCKKISLTFLAAGLLGYF